jgi:hypothetical protein
MITLKSDKYDFSARAADSEYQQPQRRRLGRLRWVGFAEKLRSSPAAMPSSCIGAACRLTKIRVRTIQNMGTGRTVEAASKHR